MGMNEEIRRLIGGRLKDERERLGWSQPKLAEVSFVSKRSVAAWESGESAPGADALAVMSISNVDVLYVLTGNRKSPAADGLAPDESTLLAAYKAADTSGKDALQAVAALAGRVAAPAKQSRNTVTISGDVGQAVAGDQTSTAPVSFAVGRGRK